MYAYKVLTLRQEMESSEAVKGLVNCQCLPSSSSSLKMKMTEMTVNRVMVLVALRAMMLVALGEILRSLQMVWGGSAENR